jgi:hypothetical protein
MIEFEEPGKKGWSSVLKKNELHNVPSSQNFRRRSVATNVIIMQTIRRAPSGNAKSRTLPTVIAVAILLLSPQRIASLPTALLSLASLAVLNVFEREVSSNASYGKAKMRRKSCSTCATSRKSVTYVAALSSPMSRRISRGPAAQGHRRRRPLWWWYSRRLRTPPLPDTSTTISAAIPSPWKI